MNNKKCKEILIITIIVLIFLIVLLPIIYISKYNHSCADDYSYGIGTHKAWQETHSVLELINAANSQVKTTYNEWQGSYSAVFLMALQPAIFGEQYYFLSTLILLGMFIFSNLYIMKIIFKYYFKINNNIIYLLISLALILISIEFVPTPVQSLFWYNGSIYYTFFYSVMLIFIGLLLKLLKLKQNKKIIIYTVLGAIIAIVLGGGNYTTALFINLIILLIEIILLIKKDKKAINIGIILAISLISFIISMIAPGNSIRQESLIKTGAFMAIIKSFDAAGKFIVYKYITKSAIWLFIAFIPIIYKIVNKIDYKFKMPIAFTIITICIYTAQYTPPLYAQGGMPQRLLNIIYYSTYWLILINLVYWIGYINSKIDIEKHLQSIKYKNIILIILIVTGIIIMGTEYKNTVTYKAIESLTSGEAEQYDKEVQERINNYEDENIKNVEIEPLTAKPYLLYYDDLTEDGNWENEALEEFYNKESVKLKIE